jgi:hypothetical protein
MNMLPAIAGMSIRSSSSSSDSRSSPTYQYRSRDSAVCRSGCTTPHTRPTQKPTSSGSDDASQTYSKIEISSALG